MPRGNAESSSGYGFEVEEEINSDLAPENPQESQTELPDEVSVKVAKIFELTKEISDPELRKKIDQAVFDLIETQEKEKNSALQQEARDSLTGLVRNLPRFVQAVEAERRLDETENSRGALLFVDLNHVKEYNKELGYQATSEIIRQFAKLADQLRQQDVTLRYGGDEFVIFMPGANPSIIGKVLVKRIMKLLENNPIIITDSNGAEKRIDVTFCVGVAPLPARNEMEDDASDYGKIIDRLITEASERTKAAKSLYSDHDQNVVAYPDKEGNDVAVSGSELFREQTTQKPAA